MKRDLKPNKYYKDIYSINYDLLLKEKIEYLLIDLDNTIADKRHKKPSKETVELFQNLHKKRFKTIIFSNALPWRAKSFAKSLDSDVFYLACKPHRFKYNKVLNKYGINKDLVAAIGDQVYTDIKGANRLNIKSILVDRISKYESVFTIPNRLKEKYFFYGKEIIRKGEYYE